MVGIKMIQTGIKYVGVLMWCMLLLPIWAGAQVTRQIQSGNSLYGQQKYKEAAQAYAKALAKDPNNTPGLFNLGNSLYQQKQYDSSRKVMERTVTVAKNKMNKAAANYNIGNTYMSEQKWEEAIDAYKKALRANPQDADAKYNLSYAEQMLKKQQQQNKDDKKKDDKKKDDKKKDDKKDKDKKDKDDKKNDKQDENKDNQDKQDKEGDDKEKEPKPQPSKLSQKQAEQLLNALQQEEKRLQDKMKKEKGAPVRMSKDW